MPRGLIFPVARLLGGLICSFGLALLVPLLTSLALHENLWRQYLIALLLCSATGGAVFWSLRNERRELLPSHAILLVIAVWVLLPLFAAVPFLLVGQAREGIGIPFTHAYFEAVSGFTTTGSTVLEDLDALPASLNVWRTFLEWIGGMGILVLAVAIMPILGVGGSQIFRVAEVSGPAKETRLTPRIANTARGLWGIYLVLSLACFLGYWAGGMPLLDALMHMFSTVSLGGGSSHTEGFGHFDSALLEAIAIFFMLLASCNFTLYFVAARQRSLRSFWNNAEARATLATLVGGGLLVSLVLWLSGTYGNPLTALRYGMFNTISMASTTAFTTADYLLWPAFIPVLLLLLSGVATSAGSTGAGIKMIRVLLLVQLAVSELVKLVHPHAVKPVRLGHAVVEPRIIHSVLAFVLVYWATIVALGMVLMLSGLDAETAFSVAIANLHCTGPALGELGPASTYAELTTFQTWVCILAMLLGRLEILSFMAVLMPSFWRR